MTVSENTKWAVGILVTVCVAIIGVFKGKRKMSQSQKQTLEGHGSQEQKQSLED